MFELKLNQKNNGGMVYNPFREMEELEKRFFAAPFSSFFNSREIAEFKTDISDGGDHYLLEADLPGFEKKDIQLEISDNILTIHAERHCEHDEKEENNNYIRIERSYGKYSRQFDVSAVDAENITAKYENGVLKLTLPKKQAPVPETKRLEIQ